jgi:hypothetical protein
VGVFHTHQSSFGFPYICHVINDNNDYENDDDDDDDDVSVSFAQQYNKVICYQLLGKSLSFSSK